MKLPQSFFENPLLLFLLTSLFYERRLNPQPDRHPYTFSRFLFFQRTVVFGSSKITPAPVVRSSLSFHF
jgi:hypothetical protein